MTNTQLYTLIIAIFGALHGPLTASVIKWARANRFLRPIVDMVQLLFTFYRRPWH